MDFCGALCALIFFAPLFLGVAFWIKLDSPGPVFFRQIRLGKGGHPFVMIKFRTMELAAPQLLAIHLSENPDARLTWTQFQKLMDDPRLTRAGKILRRLSLDELPQLWNILRGEMSLVGPRPCLPEQKEFYCEHFCWYAAVRPGLTGLWQVSGRNQLSFLERVWLDVQYVQQWSLCEDLRIMLQTPGVVFRRDGAF
ncbi:MAG: sugar transferase [Anaerolineales bacterium]|nr:sugar transferase [Anaerolineales bacterium]